ncbi:MAG: hypothetical protein IH589_14285 [Anaerolineales bacterium]|nr:hypothetical protein [Anaerolineales bacterium]
MPPKNQYLPWWKKTIQWIKRESVSVEIIFLPICFFMVDIVIRAILKVDLSDAGADMSLLATSSMVSSLLICIDNGDKTGAKASILLTLLFLVYWIIVLWIIASNHQASYLLTGAALGMGVFSFVFATYFGRGLNNG